MSPMSRFSEYCCLPGLACLASLLFVIPLVGQETRLLRQPTLSSEHVAFAYGGDLWIVERAGGIARRLTSTAAVESDPHFSPDGRQIAFTSARSGTPAVYVLPLAGGFPKRLTWYPAASRARGWTPDGKRILYSSTRETAPSGYGRLWTVSVTGGPSEQLAAPMGHDGSFSPSGKRIVIDPTSRWDGEWRNYRGGQNQPLLILNLDNLQETLLPNERTTDIQPLWLGETIYFLSDRDRVINIWSLNPDSQELTQVTEFTGADIKWLAGHDGTLIFERQGFLHTLDTGNGQTSRLPITVSGDFPWAETRWENMDDRVQSAALSPTGKRAVFEVRGEIMTVPVKKGSTRNLTRSGGAADRAPAWSSKGDEVAWFSDTGDGYVLLVANQDGLSRPREIPIGPSKMAWESSWSPDGSRLAFVDDDVRLRVVNMETGDITTADTGGTNIERGAMGLTWSPDSKWLAYARTFDNNFRRIVVWSVEDDQTHALTDSMADAVSPAWSRDGKHLYLLASTSLALGSGWANTSAMESDPEYGVYAILLSDEEKSPFEPESDEEGDEEDEEDEEEKSENESGDDDEDSDDEDSDDESQSDSCGDTDDDSPADSDDEQAESDEGGGDDSVADADEASDNKQETEKADEADDDGTDDEDESKSDKDDPPEVTIDLEGIQRRIISIPMPVARYRQVLAGPPGSLFVADGPERTLHKFSLEDREAKEFLKDASSISISSDGKKMLYRSGGAWSVCDTGSPPEPGKGRLKMELKLRVDYQAEWQQMFDEAWRYMRDYFYDPDMHGRDWEIVRERYAPLIPFVRHRADLNYVFDQMNGELSVGHSFVFGGDMPESPEDEADVGTLGADLVAHEGRWRIERIYTFESWNPNLRAPLDRPGLKVSQGNYLVGVNGVELDADEDPWRLLDGTAGQQTVLHINDQPAMDDAWTVVVEPIRGESLLRQRAWVEDNRRRVDELSDGKLAYVWVPNTGQPGVISFNRYFFAQQHKQGAVIDERFNGGGLLDDYMVDLMTRRLRAAVTNEVPDGKPFRLPAGILGPKVLLINEYAGSGGDFFPWVFRQQEAGPLIGTRTWGGLVKSSVHYSLVDGGALTAPDNAVFDPAGRRWIGENEGIPPDIEVRQDARSTTEGRDLQLERGVEEALGLLAENPTLEIEIPEYSKPARPPER